MPRETSEKARQERKSIIKQRLKYRHLRRTTNASLRCAADCPTPHPGPEKCAACKNPQCVKAFDDLENLEAYMQKEDGR